MYFDLTDEQKATRATLQELLRDKLDGRRTVELLDSGEFDCELWTNLMDLGLGAILVPEAQGGLGLDLLTLSIVAETLGHFGAPHPIINSAVAAWLIAESGDEEQRHRWVSSLVTGKAIASFAFLEENSGWLIDDWEIDGPPLNGVKNCVEWATKADLLIVGLSGRRLALVDTTSEGLSICPLGTLDRSRPLSTVTFENTPCSVLSAESSADALIDAMLTLLAADACGAGFRAYEMAVEYAQNRSQFGQIIGKFQALKHQLANMAVDMEPCRALFWYAAHAWDKIPDKRSRAAAIAKSHIADVAVKTARASVEAHGGIGYTWEYPLHIYLKRAMHARAFMGNSALHRERMAVMAHW